ncbi:MAG: flagellar hook-basal body complex protein FliE [Peptococcaceae bacterium]|nr:flagellar hook-basal body complex protein FliE [Peptococcaceae bacterium]
MNIIPIKGNMLQATLGTDNSQDSNADSFGQVLSNAIQKVNDSQVKADEMIKGFLVGDIQDIHQVTIAMGEAKIMMQLAVEVKNKAIEAYQELSRMQV